MPHVSSKLPTRAIEAPQRATNPHEHHQHPPTLLSSCPPKFTRVSIYGVVHTQELPSFTSILSTRKNGRGSTPQERSSTPSHWESFLVSSPISTRMPSAVSLTLNGVSLSAALPCCGFCETDERREKMT